MRMSILRVAMLSLIAAASVAVSAQGPFGSVVITTRPAQTKWVGKCPLTINFHAIVNYTMPHPKGFVYSYHWTRSDGATGPVKKVTPAVGGAVGALNDVWLKIGASGVYSETLHLDNGNTHVTQASTPITLTCK
jgi:hypothetical protein